jgi:DNA helicase II / ATP-dependent DNA helicase PcrA
MLLADVKRASGSNTTVKQLVAWATKCLAGTISTAGQVKALRIVLSALTTNAFSGNPANDWILVKQTLGAWDDSLFIQVAQHLNYLVAFNRGKRISANLSTAWSATGTYLRARDALDSVLTQDLILDGLDDPDGIQVMTVHKAKGKQFDAVLVLRRETHNGQTMVSNLVWRGDKTPYRRRAKVHTLMVQQVWPGCPFPSRSNKPLQLQECPRDRIRLPVLVRKLTEETEVFSRDR